MKIGFALTFAGGISGGRLHAFLLGAELAAQGHEVTFLCNQPPSFVNQMPPVPGRDLVKFEKLKFDILRPPTPLMFDLWIIVQERSLNGRFFAPVFEHARRQGVPMLLLTFETPNWQESLLPSFKPGVPDALIQEAARIGAQCLSISEVGRDWARKYFPALAPQDFHVITPVITSAWYPDPVERDPNLILAFTRRSSPHKGYDVIMRVLNSRLRGRRVVLVDGFGATYESQNFVAWKRQRDGLDIELRSNIDDGEKYRLLKSARILLYPSSFEGFGLPPGEARYWGTPVLCYDLPVLRETYGDSLMYVPAGDAAAFEATLHAELARPADFTPAPEARRVGDFSVWRENVRRTLDAVMARARPPLARSTTTARAPFQPVIVDQINNWNKEDAAAAFCRPFAECKVISFAKDAFAQAKMERDSRLPPAGELVLPIGNPVDDLRSKLLETLASTDAEFVSLTEDLQVCTAEVAGEAAAQLVATDAAGVALAERVHFQPGGTHFFRALSGELLASAGVFRRSFLLEILRTATASGARGFPVIDLSYLIWANGGRIIPGTGVVDRLPPRNGGIESYAVAGGAGTWHEVFRKVRGTTDVTDPFACLAADDAEELAFMRRFRAQTGEMLADHTEGRVRMTFLRDMTAGLLAHCPRWRAAFDPANPWETMLEFDRDFMTYGRHFMHYRYLVLFVKKALLSHLPRPLPAPTEKRFGGYYRDLCARLEEWEFVE